jgi:4-amino-4-deoxy-L-arabinose transferase-like glycosyltransferase
MPASARRVATALVFFCIVASAAASCGGSLSYHDETRVAGIARELALEQQWSAPRLNGYLFLEYPPAGYWPLAALLRLGAPASALVAQLPVVLFALGVLLLTFGMARRLAGTEAGCVAVIVLQCTVGFIALNGAVRVDPLLCFWITLALHGALFALWEPDRRGRHLAVFYGAIGLAFLSKGLIGVVLPAAVAVVLLGVTRQLALLPRLLIHPALAALVLPVGAWCLGLAQSEGLTVLSEVVRQSVFRALSSGADHAEPPWFYLERIVYLGLPAVLVLPFAVRDARSPRGPGDGPRARLDAFGLVWSATMLGVLSVASAKRNLYLGPIYPGLALAVAVWWARARERAPAGAPQRWISRAVEARPRLQACALLALATAALGFRLAGNLSQGPDGTLRGVFEDAAALRSGLDGAPIVLLLPAESLSGAAVYYLGQTVATALDQGQLEALTSERAAILVGRSVEVDSMTADLPDARRGRVRTRVVGSDELRIAAIRPLVAGALEER